MEIWLLCGKQIGQKDLEKAVGETRVASLGGDRDLERCVENRLALPMGPLARERG